MLDMRQSCSHSIECDRHRIAFGRDVLVIRRTFAPATHCAGDEQRGDQQHHCAADPLNGVAPTRRGTLRLRRWCRRLDRDVGHRRCGHRLVYRRRRRGLLRDVFGGYDDFVGHDDWRHQVDRAPEPCSQLRETRCYDALVHVQPLQLRASIGKRAKIILHSRDPLATLRVR